MRRGIAYAGIIGLLMLVGPGTFAQIDPSFTTDFRLEDCTFSAWGKNPYFSLVPGHELELEGDDDGELLELEIEVLHRTRWVSFTLPSRKRMRVNTRVVQETEWVDGELAEISRNFFARCIQTNSIFYFGEEVDIYEDGEIVSHDGAWIAGVNGALPGLIMPGTFLLGSKYYQEIAPGVALDQGTNTAMGLTVEVEAGTFHNCVEVIDTNGLNPGGSGDTKIYCPGIGLVIDEAAELTEYEIGGRRHDDD